MFILIQPDLNNMLFINFFLTHMFTHHHCSIHDFPFVLLFIILLLDKRKFSLLFDITDPGKGILLIATALQTVCAVNEKPSYIDVGFMESLINDSRSIKNRH